MITFYVDSKTGKSQAAGDQKNPFGTITEALRQAKSGSLIQVKDGEYTEETGETFPLIVPTGVELRGNPGTHGRGVWIVGAGHHFSPMFKDQQITVIARGNSKIRGVTIQNNGDQGTGLWLENAYPEIKENFFYQNSREGIFVAGDSNPLIEDNVFEEQSSSGIFFVSRAQGIVINNFFQGNRRAIAITGQASPQITSNQIINNDIGLILSRDCAPRLRHNLIKNSSDTGLLISGAAQPDLGYEEEPGQNIFENNHHYDLHNKTSEEIIFVGNGINLDKIAGPVQVIPIDGPDLFEVEMTDETFGNVKNEEDEADFDLMTFTQKNLANTWEEGDEEPASIGPEDEEFDELGLYDHRDDDIESGELDLEPSSLSDDGETDSLAIDELSLIEKLGSMMDDDEDFMDFDQGIMAEIDNLLHQNEEEIISGKEDEGIGTSPLHRLGEQSFSFEQTVIEELEPTPTAEDGLLDFDPLGYDDDATVIEALPQDDYATIIESDELADSFTDDDDDDYNIDLDLFNEDFSDDDEIDNAIEQDNDDLEEDGEFDLLASTLEDEDEDDGANLLDREAMEFLEFVAEDGVEEEAITSLQRHNLRENNPPLIEEGQRLGLLPSSLETLIEEAQPLTAIEGEQVSISMAPSAPSAEPAIIITDISKHWAHDFIVPLIKANLMEMEEPGQFKPHDLLTREAYALIVAKAFNLPKQIAQKTRFIDLDFTYPNLPAIKKAAGMGFVSRFPDKTFRPDHCLTRIEVLTSLVQGLGLRGSNKNLLNYYADSYLIPTYAIVPMLAAIEANLIFQPDGSNYLHPLEYVTRGEMAAILYQVLLLTNQVQPIKSELMVVHGIKETGFKDLQNHWAQAPAMALNNMKLVKGFPDGTFKPNLGVDRTEYATLVTKILNASPVRPISHFRDVPDEFWGLSALEKAYQWGFLATFPDQTIHPHQQLKRINVIASLASGLGLEPNPDNRLEHYQDWEEVPMYAFDAVSAMDTAGLLVNFLNPNYLEPKRDIGRGELIAMLYQVLVYQGKALPIGG